MPGLRIAVQHATSAGRFHPAYYRWSPVPGRHSDDTGVQRYKSMGHHTDGFATLAEAQTDAAGELATRLGIDVPDGGFPVRQMPVAGADVLLVDERVGC